MLTIKCNCQKHRSLPLVVCRKPSLATPMWVSTCRCFPSAKIVLPRHKKCDSRSTWQSGVLYSAFCQTPRADQSNTRVRTYLAICRLKQCIKLKTLSPCCWNHYLQTWLSGVSKHLSNTQTGCFSMPITTLVDVDQGGLQTPLTQGATQPDPTIFID